MAGGLLGHVIDALSPIDLAFDEIVADNVRKATPWPVPPAYAEWLLAYAEANPVDGAILRAGLARGPACYRGGWILDLQSNAIAITLDRAIFFRGDVLELATWIHELVHVHQYSEGSTLFLGRYFGQGAATIVERMIRREPLDIMTAAAYETVAYGVGERFVQWWAARA